MQAVNEPTEVDRDVCGRAIIVSETRRDAHANALTASSKLRLHIAHKVRKAEGQGIILGDDMCLGDLGFVKQSCKTLAVYLHVSGRVWTEDADGWVCDCTGVEIAVRQ